MSKLCVYYNTAPHYRKAIFSAIDREFDCDWYFGVTTTDIREMDISKLKSATYYKTIGNPRKLFWSKNLIHLFFSGRYDAVFALNEVRNLAMWMLVLLIRIFRPKRKLYVWTHGCYGREGKLRQKLEKWKYSTFDGAFLYNQRAKDILISYGVDADKLFVIGNSLDYDSQLALRRNMTSSGVYADHFRNDNHNVIFIGRLTKVKRLEMLMEAVAKMPDVNLTLIGDGEEARNLRDLASRLGITDRVWLYGPCYDEAVNANLIYNADLCVAPGNVGLTAMHSMVFGTPVISHDDLPWQMPEFEAIRPGETGAFFKRDSVDSLAEAIRGWLAGPGKDREKVRQACFSEIDTKWNPYRQMDILHKYLKY